MSYTFANNPNNPDAKPLYNDNILKIWNWFDTVWTCDDWETWHKSMSNKYGREAANRKFLTDWNNLATGSSAIDCRTFNSEFRDYMRKVGLLDSLYSGVAVITKPIGTVTDVVTSTGNTVSSGFKVISKVVPVIIFVVLVYVLIIGYKKYAKK